MKRRDLLFLGGLAALAGGWQVLGVRSIGMSFEPLAGAPEWQFAAVGSLSGATGADLITIGMEQGPPPLPADQLDRVVHRDAREGPVPVAVFSDFMCPYCRTLMGRLTGRSAMPPIAITWHELPLRGPNSVLVARAAQAAAFQGGYVAFYAQLLRDGFRPLPRWMGQVADAAGLDGAKLRRDMDGTAVADRLLDSARAARTLGFIGTPGLAVGRSAVLGALSTDQMEDLIAQKANL